MTGRTISLLLLGVLFSCGKAVPKESIKIGALLSITGSLAQHGTDELDGVAFAVDEINKHGGVLGGQLLEVVHRDDASDKANAPPLVDEMIGTFHTPVIIGAAGSAITLNVLPQAQAAQVVMISPGASSPLLTTAADDGYLFRTIPSDALQGKLFAQRAYAKGFRKVSIIYVNNAYGQGLSDTFAQVFTAAGGTVTTKVAYVEHQSSYSALIDGVYAAGTPDAILAVAYQVDGASMIEDYVQRLLSKNTFWFFSDSFYGPDFVTGVGASSFTFQHEGAVPATPTSDRFNAFRDAFSVSAARAPSIYTANGYDAVYLAALAMEASNKADGALIKAALPAVSAGGTKYGASEYTEAIKAVHAGTDIDYEGASGPVDFDTNGDVIGAYDIWGVDHTTGLTIKDQSISPAP